MYYCKNNVSGMWKLSFHVFPLKKPSLLRSWLPNVKRKNFCATLSSSICSEHFTVDSFVPDKYAEHLASLAQAAGRTYNKPFFIKLREDAVATIFVHRQSKKDNPVSGEHYYGNRWTTHLPQQMYMYRRYYLLFTFSVRVTVT